MPDNNHPEWAWKDGSFIPYQDCTLHVRTQAVMVAASVFEGIKAFWNDSTESLYLFRLDDHLQRLRNSMKMMRMQTTAPSDLDDICVDLLARNRFAGNVHMMPTTYVGEGKANVALAPPTGEGMFITAVLRPPNPYIDQGLHVSTSTWTRISDQSVPPRIKAAGNYQNGRLALNEAWANGYDNCLMLNPNGSVAEGPGACVFVVSDGKICTPPVTDGILESITRESLMTLFEEKTGNPVIERSINRTELYTADEILMCGSGMDVVPVLSVDRIEVADGKKGPATQAVQDAYFAVGKGEDTSHAEWRTLVRTGPGTTLT